VPYGLFRWCLCARLCRAEIWFVSIGAGPIHHPVSRRLMKAAAAMAQYRSYRDVVSKAFMTSIGFDARADRIYPDIAFALPTPDDGRAAQAAPARLAVAVGVMRYRGWQDDGAGIYAAYLAKMRRFVSWLLEQGHEVRILTGDRTDCGAVDDLMQALGPDAASVVAEPTSSLHELMEQIARVDMVVGTRFHNVVCSHKLARPVISIGYADKNDALQEEMGLGPFCQQIETLSIDRLIEQFETLAREREAHAVTIGGVTAAYRVRLSEQESLLAKRLTADRSDSVARVATAVALPSPNDRGPFA
jgi:polysaccharide pyruvyl transferase WcaK-like protein